MWLIELVMHSQTSTGVPLKFGNEEGISSRNLHGYNYLFLVELKLIHVSKRAPGHIHILHASSYFVVIW